MGQYYMTKELELVISFFSCKYKEIIKICYKIIVLPKCMQYVYKFLQPIWIVFNYFIAIQEKYMGSCFCNRKPSQIYSLKDSGQYIFQKKTSPLQNASIMVQTFKQKIYPQLGQVCPNEFSKDQWRSIKYKNLQSGKLLGLCKWKSDTQDYLDKQGLLYYKNKSVQYLIGGRFDSGKLDKKQKYFRIFENGSYYIGQLNNNFDPHGSGQLHTADDIYTGDFNQGIPHGNGKRFLKDQDRTFEGTFKNGEIIEGKQITQKGIYYGKFKNNRKHGKGLLRMNSGVQFQGTFVNNKKQGQGIMRDASGNIKQAGIWQEDKFKQKKSIK